MRRVDLDEVRRILDETRSKVPSGWTGAYVGERMIDSFRTLARMPGGGHRLLYRQVILDVLHDTFAEELTRLQAGNDTTPLAVRLRPSPRDIRLMELALVWPMQYLPHDQATRHCVMIWAHGMAINKPAGRMNTKVRARYGLSKDAFHRARLAGCMTIALGLQRDRVPVE
jgi:hypothetical protein